MAEKVRSWGHPEVHSRFQADLLFITEPCLKTSHHHHYQHRHCGRSSVVTLWQSQIPHPVHADSIKKKGQKSCCTLRCLSRVMKHQDLNSKTCSQLNLAYTVILVCSQVWELAKKHMLHPVAKYSIYTYCTKWNYHELLPAIAELNIIWLVLLGD